MEYKVIVIDPVKREVREGVASGLESLQTLIGGLIAIATEFANNDVVFVDDEGLFKDQRHWFSIDGVTHQPFAGTGVVVGTDRKGDSVKVKTSIDEIRSKIKFLSEDDVRNWE